MTFEEFADALFKRHDYESWSTMSRKEAELLMRSAWYAAREEYAREKLTGSKQAATPTPYSPLAPQPGHPYKGPKPKYSLDDLE